MERVVIESPYAADTEEGIDINEAYAELAMHDCLVNYNESPYASHLLYEMYQKKVYFILILV